MKTLIKMGALLAPFTLVALSAGCEETRTITEIQTDTVTVVETDTVRVGNEGLQFDQIERLGKPLVSEALLEKRLHSFHNTTTPATDSMFFRDDIVAFVVNVAGRDTSTAETIAAVLLPDMLLIYPNRASGVTASDVDAAASVGWLTWTPLLGDGYGGRKLDNDDAVDKALAAVFGSLLSDQNTSPGLSTDNVPEETTDPDQFPYIAEPF